jgi:Fe(3+) dicitrate transport protein
LSYLESFWGLDHQIDVGIRYHEDEVRRRHQQRSYLMRSVQMVSDGIERPYKTNNFAHTDALAVSLSNQISWADWTFNVGVRHEDISGRVDNILTGTSVESDQSITAPGFGAHLQLTDTIGVLVGVYVGFSPSGPGKSGADAEESTNFEYGVRYSTPAISGEVIAFHSDYDNLLGRCRASDSDCNIGQEFSGGVVEVSGIEFLGEFELAITEGWLLTSSLNYTYSDSKFEESFFSQFSQWGLVDKGDELPYIPKHVGRWQVALEGDHWSLDLALKYQHKMREEPGSGAIESGLHSDSLTVVDLALSRVVNDNLELKLLLRNAADKAAIVSHRPYGARPNQPRTLLAQVKYRF